VWPWTACEFLPPCLLISPHLLSHSPLTQPCPRRIRRCSVTLGHWVLPPRPVVGKSFSCLAWSPALGKWVLMVTRKATCAPRDNPSWTTQGNVVFLFPCYSHEQDVYHFQCGSEINFESLHNRKLLLFASYPNLLFFL
jgi:hypothetical protein